MASTQNAGSSNETTERFTALGSELSAIDALLKALGSRELSVRQAAASSLLELDAGPVLASRLIDATQPERARQQAAVALRLLKLESTVPALVTALSDPAAPVRASVALALSMFGARAAEDALIAALDDRCDDVRYYAADALGAVRSAKTKAALQRRQEVEEHMAVQLALKGSLAKNG